MPAKQIAYKHEAQEALRRGHSVIYLLPEIALTPQVCDDPPTDEQLREIHRTIDKVTRDIEALYFNTAIARMMEVRSISRNSRPMASPTTRISTPRNR